MTTLAETSVLCLRTCGKDMKSHGGFQWPESGRVEAPDWEPTGECGHGLHGWLWGSGAWSLKAGGDDIWWLVFEADSASVVDLFGKVKVPRCDVVFRSKHWWEAMAYIRDHAAGRVKFECVATGDCGNASATGDYGHASATGGCGNASATGRYGHASATGRCGNASATGPFGHASATGDFGHASATGPYGHASATGPYGNASATGEDGWAICGNDGRAKAGPNGVLSILWWDGKRYRVATGYVGEDGIEADTWYAVRGGKIVSVTEREGAR